MVETQLQALWRVVTKRYSLDIPALVGSDTEPAVGVVRGRAVRREPVDQLRLIDPPTSAISKLDGKTSYSRLKDAPIPCGSR